MRRTTVGWSYPSMDGRARMKRSWDGIAASHKWTVGSTYILSRRTPREYTTGTL